ncbi:MAG TPA: FtsX-like permease family protein [Dehalococcoidia bacterium]|nr:FtsX-like permease family protein [Dehalococcoidia bacterium]
MKSLFGIPMNGIMIGLLVIVGAALLAFVLAAVRNPVLFKLGLRNIPRRRAQSIIIVFGLMVSTMIIAAAFAVGDSLDYSITKSVYDNLGALDLRVQTRPVGGAAATAGAPYISGASVSAIEDEFGTPKELLTWVPMINEPAPVGNPRTRLTEPQYHLVGLDPAVVQKLGGLAAKGGGHVELSDLGPNEVFINATAADKIDARPGDTIVSLFNNQQHSFTVKAIVNDQIMTGWQDVGNSNGNGGIVLPLEAARQIVGKPDGVNQLYLSTSKDSHAGLTRGEKLFPTLKDAVNSAPVIESLDSKGVTVKAVNAKHDFVNTAETLGNVFTTLFVVIGLFSIAAGMMLIFLIFVMLAAERRAEMGMARAVGISRLGLVQSFLAEGMVYNLLAGIVGAALGVGVAFLIIWIAANLIFTGNNTLPFAGHVSPRSVVVAYCLGVALTFITVVFSSYRTTRMNIVAAIRDMPEDTVKGREPRRVKGAAILSSVLRLVGGIAVVSGLTAAGSAAGLGLGIAAAGLVLLIVAPWLVGRRGWGVAWRALVSLLPGVAPVWAVLGILRGFGMSWTSVWSVVCLLVGLLSLLGSHAAGSLFLFAAGVSITALGLALIARVRGVSNRVAFTAFGVLMLVYWLLPFDVLKNLFGSFYGNDSGNFEMFFLSGVMIVLASTLVLIFNGELLARLVNRVGGGLGSVRPALATAIAYPMASKLRTGLTLGMFSLIIFSITVMSSVNSNTAKLFAGDSARGGWDVNVDTNLNNNLGDFKSAMAKNGVDTSKIAAMGATTGYRGTTDIRMANSTKWQRYFVRAGDPAFLDANQMKIQAHVKDIPKEQIWKTLETQPTDAVIDAGALSGQQGGGSDGPNFVLKGVKNSDKTFDKPIDVVIRDAAGKETTLHVIGVIDQTVQNVFATLMVSGSTYTQSLGQPAFDLYSIRLTPGTDDKVYAKSIRAALSQYGVQATSIRSDIADALAIQKGISYLFEGFMGLGLFVGIAAVAVIAARTVVERRQQIGMLRAVGYRRGQVALSFALETSFIALFGIAAGVITASILSYNLFTSTTFGDTSGASFSLPWAQIIIFAGVGYLLSLLMTYIPSRQAASLPIAEALRYE